MRVALGGIDLQQECFEQLGRVCKLLIKVTKVSTAQRTIGWGLPGDVHRELIALAEPTRDGLREGLDADVVGFARHQVGVVHSRNEVRFLVAIHLRDAALDFLKRHVNNLA